MALLGIAESVSTLLKTRLSTNSGVNSALIKQSMRKSASLLLMGFTKASVVLKVLNRYVPNIKKVTQVKSISPSQSIWTLYYTFPPPVSPRVFTVLQTTHLDQASRTGSVVFLFFRHDKR